MYMKFLNAGPMTIQIPQGNEQLSGGFYRNLGPSANKNRNGGWFKVTTRRIPQEV
jgi:hypothetical protein